MTLSEIYVKLLSDYFKGENALLEAELFTSKNILNKEGTRDFLPLRKSLKTANESWTEFEVVCLLGEEDIGVEARTLLKDVDVLDIEHILDSVPSFKSYITELMLGEGVTSTGLFNNLFHELKREAKFLVSNNNQPSFDIYDGFITPNLMGTMYTIRSFIILPILFGDTKLYLTFLSPYEFNVIKFLYHYYNVGETTYDTFIYWNTPIIKNTDGIWTQLTYTNYNKIISCSDCGDYFVSNNINFNGRNFCNDCRMTDNGCFAQIEITGNIIGNCRRCPNSSRCVRHILRYNENPKTEFYHNDNTMEEKERETTYYGVELEIEKYNANGFDDISDADFDNDFNKIKGNGDNNLPFVYGKHDGSLSYGYEIVTQPSEFEYLKRNMKTIINRALKNGYTSHNSGRCGLHIHINRKALDTNTIANMMQIIYGNWNDFVEFSRRKENHLRWCQQVYIDKEYDDTPAKIIGKSANGEKYVAVNLLHEHSVELRLFRGTLKYNTFVATLQLVDNLVKLSRKITLKEASKTTFRDVVMFNHTKELKTYLGERQIDIETIKKHSDEKIVPTPSQEFYANEFIDSIRTSAPARQYVHVPPIDMGSPSFMEIDQNNLSINEGDDLTRFTSYFLADEEGYLTMASLGRNEDYIDNITSTSQARRRFIAGIWDEEETQTVEEETNEEENITLDNLLNT